VDPTHLRRLSAPRASNGQRNNDGAVMLPVIEYGNAG
jgi:hypothetical protein